MHEDVELTVMTMSFDAVDPVRLHPVLARYVVMARGEPGCRNIDLCVSVLEPRRYVVLAKWSSPADQQAHVAGPRFAELAAACRPLVAAPPIIDLLDAISAHDLA